VVHSPLIEIVAIIAASLVAIYAFSNGFKDASSIVATTVSTRTLSPAVALSLVAVFEFFGASYLGTAVAKTIGGKIIYFPTVNTGLRGLLVICGALIGALGWNIFCWYRALPTSSGQALLGGLLGACVSGLGVRSIAWKTGAHILLSLVGTPILSFFVAAIITWILSFISEDLSPRWNDVFRWLQVPSCIAVSLAYSTNDAQSAMGVMTLGLMMGGLHGSPGGSFHVPRWVIQTCAFAIALGVLVGGSRMLKTLGMKFYKIRPFQGLGAQASSAIAITAASVMGLPASTTQVITTSILGAGASLRPKEVRWALAQEIVLAWLVTIPSTALLGAIAFQGLNLFFNFIGK